MNGDGSGSNGYAGGGGSIGSVLFLLLLVMQIVALVGFTMAYLSTRRQLTEQDGSLLDLRSKSVQQDEQARVLSSRVAAIAEAVGKDHQCDLTAEQRLLAQYQQQAKTNSAQLSSQLKDVTTKQAEVEARFGGLGANVASAESQLKRLTGSMNDANVTLAGNQERLNALDRTLSDTETKVSSVRGTADSLQSDLSNTRKLVSDLEKRTDALDVASTDVRQWTRRNTGTAYICQDFGQAYPEFATTPFENAMAFTEHPRFVDLFGRGRWSVLVMRRLPLKKLYRPSRAADTGNEDEVLQNTDPFFAAIRTKIVNDPETGKYLYEVYTMVYVWLDRTRYRDVTFELDRGLVLCQFQPQPGAIKDLPGENKTGVLIILSMNINLHVDADGNTPEADMDLLVTDLQYMIGRAEKRDPGRPWYLLLGAFGLSRVKDRMLALQKLQKLGFWFASGGDRTLCSVLSDNQVLWNRYEGPFAESVGVANTLGFFASATNWVGGPLSTAEASGQLSQDDRADSADSPDATD